MSIEKNRDIELSAIFISGQEDIGGAQKIAFRYQSRHGQIAAKIYRPYNESSLVPQDQTLRAIKEFETYQIFRQTSALPITPLPIGYITERGKVTGLAVEWKEGELLRTSQILSSVNLRQIAYIATSLPQQYNLLPDIDIFEEANLITTRQGNIWLAECAIATTNPSQEQLAGYADQLKRLLEGYKQYLR